jgi:hypothetical protein
MAKTNKTTVAEPTTNTVSEESTVVDPTTDAVSEESTLVGPTTDSVSEVSDEKLYKVLEPINHDLKEYEPGELIYLSLKQAEILLAVRAIAQVQEV